MGWHVCPARARVLLGGSPHRDRTITAGLELSHCVRHEAEGRLLRGSEVLWGEPRRKWAMRDTREFCQITQGPCLRQ